MPGRYAAIFYFIERRFDTVNRDRYAETPADPRAGGGRLFSIFRTGKAVLRDLNLTREAGQNRPSVRKVTGLERIHEGKLRLEFVPTPSYATVTAIEAFAQDN